MSKIKTILSIIFIFTIWGCVSSAYQILWWSRECVLYLIIIIKPEVWIINHCLGLGHETMVCAVCLTMFLLRTEISWRRPMWNRLTLEKKISSWKLTTSPFSSWIHPFPIKNCSIYNSTVFVYQSSKHLMPVCAVDNFRGELNIAAPKSSWPRPTTIFKKSNFNHGACLKDIPMKSGMLVAQIQWNQQAKFQGKY